MLYEEDKKRIQCLRYMLAVLLERQSSVTLSEHQRMQCKEGIDALQRAVESLGTQIYA